LFAHTRVYGKFIASSIVYRRRCGQLSSIIDRFVDRT